MLVVPVSFGAMAALALCIIVLTGISGLWNAIFSPPPRGLTRTEIRQRRGLPPPARLTRWHRAFALGVPLTMLLIIVALHAG